MKALIDTCVIVDVLQKREPFYKAAMNIVLAISNRWCLGVLTAKSITDVYYILRRSLHNEEKVRQLLRILFTLFDVEDTFSTDCQLALGSPMKDYEDAIMVQTAVRVGADCIVTRNLKDYALSTLPVYAPEEFLQKLAEEHTNDE
ncbi:MAG TPA: PIN domain nuclease [Lachnospiraceae bacterium]|nr:PIN domain nuclease [Lachnospiraceae bacterium]